MSLCTNQFKFSNSVQLTPEERPIIIETHNRTSKIDTTERRFHEKRKK